MGVCELFSDDCSFLGGNTHLSSLCNIYLENRLVHSVRTSSLCLCIGLHWRDRDKICSNLRAISLIGTII